MAFAYQTPSIQQGYGYRDPIKATSAGFGREDFLNEIIDSINKATGTAQSKVSKAGGVSDVLGLLSMFLPPGYREGAMALTKLGETLYTQDAMKDAQRVIDKQSGRGFLSSTLPTYGEDWKTGTKDMLVGNVLEGVSAVAMPSLMKKFKTQNPLQLAMNTGQSGDLIDSLIEGFDRNPTPTMLPNQSLIA